MWKIWLGLLISGVVGSRVSIASRNGDISNFWTLFPSLGIALCWSFTTRIYKGSLANIGIMFDIISGMLWVMMFAANGEKVTIGTAAGFGFFVLGLLSIKYL